MKLELNIPLKIVIEEDGKTKETLSISYRYPTAKEEKEAKKEFERFQKFSKDFMKIKGKLENTQKRVSYAENCSEYEKAEKLLDKKEAFEAEMEKLEEEMDTLGGDNFGAKKAKKAFELFVSGKDKEKLKGYCESLGYERVLSLLNKERNEVEKKQLSK